MVSLDTPADSGKRANVGKGTPALSSTNRAESFNLYHSVPALLASLFSDYSQAWSAFSEFGAYLLPAFAYGRQAPSCFTTCMLSTSLLFIGENWRNKLALGF